MNTLKIKISLRQIYDYMDYTLAKGNPNIKHDGISLNYDDIVKILEYISNISNLKNTDLEKIYEIEYTDYTYLTDNIQATGDIDITAYTKIPPYPSWIIGDDGEWTPPIAYPDGDGSGMGTLYNWNETKKSWEDILV